VRLASVIRPAALALLGVALSSCDRKEPLAPATHLGVAPAADGAGAPAVVISQVYGGGGNSGATLKNDFVELFNPGTAAVSLAGWSVQYASATGSSWQVTALAGTIQPGAYFLVQEAKGSGGTVDLPAPDATGTIAMSANNGKVWLVSAATALSGACPTGTAVVDEVSFGTTASNCGFGTTSPSLTNTTAALRKGGGCTYTGVLSADFDVLAPAPRNGASQRRSCLNGPPVSVVLSPNPGSVSLGGTLALSAEALDADGLLVSPALTWTAGDGSVASVDTNGVVSAVGIGATTVTATAGNGVAGTTTVNVAPAVIAWLDVSSSSTSMPPGFQTQLFATARTGSGGLVVPATFTFEALNPDTATVAPVENSAIVTGVSPGRARVRITATPVSGGTPPYSFTTSSINIETPAAVNPSIYAKNDEFGDPAAASASDPDNLLIARPQYTISYNELHGTPNWVSYELDSRQMGGEDRCNCFTADPLLPADRRILTSDYTNGGYDRGHMTRSFDRTATNLDNAATFYLTNIVPQTADLNQGPWAAFEDALGDSAQAGRAVYIIAGPLYSRGHGLTFLKNEGKVAVPDSTWKVALIGPRSGGLPFGVASLAAWADLPGVTLLAVSMPNVAGIKNVAWTSYLTTVDRIETATGYDFLSLLPVAFQTALEAGDHAPAAAFSVTGTPDEGTALTFDASTTTDPDLGRTGLDRTEALAYAWTFGDGSSATGEAPSKAFGRGGAYDVTLTVTDAWGWPSVVSRSVSIANVPPHVGPIPDTTLLQGETYAASGSFVDPGLEPWTATVDFGDGSGSQALTLDGKSFQLSHSYVSAGTFSLGVTVSDGEATGQGTAMVTVLTPLQGIAALAAAVDSLGGSGGPLRPGEVRSLQAELKAATAACGRDRAGVCALALGAFRLELRALVLSRRLGDALAAPLVAFAGRVIAVLRA